MTIDKSSGSFSRPKATRALLKISGEGFGEEAPLEEDSICYLVNQVCQAKEESGAELALVVGGGNIIRGARQKVLNRQDADLAGMVATIINGLALRSELESRGFTAVIQSALHLDRATRPVDPQQAKWHMKEGRIVIFAGGTGNPYFTTDSAAALRAGEIGADLIIKGTQVKGVYTADPSVEESAQFIPELTFSELIEKRLEIVDLSAAQICDDLDIPMVICDLHQEGTLQKVLAGEDLGTLVHS